MTINCLIVDDERLARRLLSEYVRQMPQLNLVAQCANAMEAQWQLQQHTIELLLLDIQMPALTGLDFLKSLPSHQRPLVIFTTAYSEYALQAFELEVIDYLVKPIAFDRFFQAINKTIRRLTLEKQAQNHQQQSKNDVLTNKERNYFFVKSDYKMVKVVYNDILFIQSLRDYVRIYTLQQKIVTLQSMNKLQEILPKKQFIRTHRSYIVNMNRVDSVEGNFANINKHKIPISKRMKKDFLDSLRY